MIILRQKEFATGVERMMVAKNKIHPIPTPNRTAIRQLDHTIPYKKAELVNKISTFPQRFMSGYYEGRRNFVPKAKESKLLEKKALADRIVAEKTKSKRQLLKDIAASKEEAKTKKLKSKINRLEAINSLGTKDGAIKYAGKKVADFVNMTAENPLSSAGIAIGYGSTPIQVATGHYWGPIGTVSMATERAAKKAFPGYKKLTDRSARFVKSKHIGDKASVAAQYILNSIPV